MTEPAPRPSPRIGTSERDAATEAQGKHLEAGRWLVLSAVALLAMGGIHLYLALTSTGGMLGMLFVLNGIGGLVLAIALVVLRGPLLATATVLALLLLAGTLASLVLALTVGLFGLQSSLDYELAPTTLVVETVGTVVLLVTTVLVLRRRTP